MTRRNLLAALVVISLACGKRGDPKPPIPIIPQATSDLLVTQRADKVILSWSYPSLTTAGRSLKAIRRISIYRYVESLPVAPGGRDPNSILPGDIDPTLPQPIALFAKIPTIPKAQFQKLATRVESIEKANLASATTGSKLLYTDTPPFQSEDGRPVRLTYAVVTEGELARGEPSNLAIVVPLPVAIPPAGLTVSIKPDAVTLGWAAPTQSIGTAGGSPVIAGYNVYRTGPGDEPGELAAPVNTALIKGTTYSETPAYGEYDYRVAAVASSGPPLIQSDLSAPVRVAFKDLIPPPAPTGVTALLEPKLVRLLWNPVETPDLDGYYVYRVEKKVRLKLTPQPIHGTNFVDISIQLGPEYTYEITAADKSGNESAPATSDPVRVPKEN